MTQTKPPLLLSSESLSKTKVLNHAGKSLGHIETLMIDVRLGKITYAVLSFGGFMGFGDKLFAIPWESLGLDTNEEAFLLNVDEERLRRMPGFDKDDWPDFADERFQATIHEFYADPSWKGVGHVGT